MLLAFFVGFLYGKDKVRKDVIRIIKDEKILGEMSRTAKEIDKRVPRRTVADMLQTAKERQP
jgi:hypothetical protein